MQMTTQTIAVTAIFIIQSRKIKMNKKVFKLKSLAIAVAVSNMATLSANAEDRASLRAGCPAVVRGTTSGRYQLPVTVKVL